MAINVLRIIDVPLPTHRLASSALRALQVDAELSALVSRSFSLVAACETASGTLAEVDEIQAGRRNEEQEKTVLRTEYKATTNRMLRVAVNGFMESLGVVLGVMEELDVDVFDDARNKS